MIEDLGFKFKADTSDFDKWFADVNWKLDTLVKRSSSWWILWNLFKWFLWYKAISLGLEWLQSVTTWAVQKAIDLEQAFQKVKKTLVDPSTFWVVKQWILDLSKTIPLPIEEIAKLEEILSQTWISDKWLKQATTTVAEFWVAANLAWEEAALWLTQMQNAMWLSEDKISNIAASVTYLWNTTATQETNILEYWKRLAALSSIANFSAWDILWLWASLASVWIPAERWATAFSAFAWSIVSAVAKWWNELNTFAQLAWLSADQFKEAWKTDTMNTTLTILKKINAQWENSLWIFDALEWKNKLRNQTFLQAAKITDQITKNTDAWNKAYAENNAHVKESNTLWETTASKIQLAKNAFAKFQDELGTKMLPLVNKFLDLIAGPKFAKAIEITISWLQVLWNAFLVTVNVADQQMNRLSWILLWLYETWRYLTKQSSFSEFQDELDNISNAVAEENRAIKNNLAQWITDFKNSVTEFWKVYDWKIEIAKTAEEQMKIDQERILQDKLKQSNDYFDTLIQQEKNYANSKSKILSDLWVDTNSLDKEISQKIADLQKQKLISWQKIQYWIVDWTIWATNTSLEEDILLPKDQAAIDKRIKALQELKKNSNDYTIDQLQNNDRIRSNLIDLQLEYEDYSNQVKDLQDQRLKSTTKEQQNNIDTQIKIINDLKVLKESEINIQKNTSKNNYDIKIKELEDAKSIAEQKSKIEENAGNKTESKVQDLRAQSLKAQIQQLKEQQYLAEEHSTVLLDIQRKQKEQTLKEKQDEYDKLEKMQARFSEKVQVSRDFWRDFLWGQAFSAYRSALSSWKWLNTTDLQSTSWNWVNIWVVNVTDNTAVTKLNRTIWVWLM